MNKGEELKQKMADPQWWLHQKELRGTTKTFLELVNTMNQSIRNLKPKQFIRISDIKAENRELFMVIAAEHIMFNNDFIFSNDYGKFYRTEVDSRGDSILDSSCC